MKKLDQPHKALIMDQFELEQIDPTDDEALLETLADRIASLLLSDMESFMSLMYRMDVSEKKVAAALSPDHDDPPNLTLAKLIIERQLLRMETKKKYRQQPLQDWIDF